MDSSAGASRAATAAETAVLKELVNATVDEGHVLLKQIESVKVRPIDSDGSLELVPPPDSPKAAVVGRVPVEGEVEDHDGIVVHVLLHVVDGLVAELEIYRDDLKQPRWMLAPNQMRIQSFDRHP